MLRKTTRRLIISATILGLAATALVFFWDPMINYLAKRFVLDQISRRIGGQATVEEIHSYLFPPSFKVDGLKITMDKGPLRQLTVKEIMIEPGIGPVFIGEVNVKKILIKDPSFFFDLMSETKKVEKKKTFTFEIPKASDLIKLKIESLEVEGAKLSLALPGEEIRVEVDQGKATYQSGGSSEVWSWKGVGELYKKNKKVSLEDVFVLAERDEDRLYIKDFHIKGLGVEASMRGPVLPKADLSVTISSELEVLAKALLALEIGPDLANIQGTVDMRGKLTGGWNNIALKGEMKGKNLSFAERKVNFLQSSFSLDRNQLHSLEAQIISNEIRLEAKVQNVSKNSPGSFQVVANDILFQEVEKWIDPDTQESTLKGPLNLETQGLIGFSPFLLAGDYQVTAPKLNLVIGGGVDTFLPLKFEQVKTSGEFGWSKERNFFLEAGEISAKGLEGKYRFEFPKEGKSTGIWLGTVHDIGGIFESSIPISGHGQVTGGLEVEGKQFQATVNLNMESFKYAAREDTKMVGELVFKRKEVLLKNFEIIGQKARVKLDADFDQNAEGGMLKANFKDFDLGWIADVAAKAYPVVDEIEGVGNGEVYLSNFITGMDGHIQLESKDTRWNGVAFNQVSAMTDFSDGTATFQRTELKNDQNLQVVLTGKASPEGYQDLKLSFLKAPLRFLKTPWVVEKMADHVDGKIVMNGDADNPSLEASLQFYRYQASEDSYAWSGIGATSGPLDQLKWSLSFDADTLEATGKIDLKNISNFEGRGKMQKFSLAPLLQDVPSEVDAVWEMRGIIGDLSSWGGNFSISSFTASKSLRLEAPVSINMIQGQIQPVNFILQGDDSRLVANLSLGSRGHVAGNLTGTLPLSMMTLFQTGVARAEGSLAVELDFGGEFSNLRAGGNFSSKGALIQFKDFPHDLENASISGTVDQSTLYFDDISAIVAGGQLNARGTLNFSMDSALRKIALNGYVDRASMRFPSWIPITTSGRISLVGPLPGPKLSGELLIHQGRYEDEWDWKSKILTFAASSKKTRILRTEEEALYLDLHFVTEGDSFLLKNNIAEAKLRGDVRVVGSDRKMGLLGKVEIIQGDVEFLDNLFQLSPGVVTFDKSDDIHPVFDLSAKTTVQQTDIFLDIRSEDDDIVAFLSSQPYKDETNIIALLTVGVDSDELLLNRQGSNQMSSTLLPGVLSAPVQSKLQKGLKETRVLDTLQFVPFFSDQTQNTGIRVLVGKELFPKVKLLYSTDLFNVGAENTVRLEQSFNDNVSLQGSVRDNRQDQQNPIVDFGVDFEFRFDF